MQTERLVLRELEQGDYAALCRILQDEETMYAYEGAFSDGKRTSGSKGRSRATKDGASGLGP